MTSTVDWALKDNYLSISHAADLKSSTIQTDSSILSLMINLYGNQIDRYIYMAAGRCNKNANSKCMQFGQKWKEEDLKKKHWPKVKRGRGKKTLTKSEKRKRKKTIDQKWKEEDLKKTLTKSEKRKRKKNVDQKWKEEEKNKHWPKVKRGRGKKPLTKSEKRKRKKNIDQKWEQEEQKNHWPKVKRGRFYFKTLTKSER